MADMNLAIEREENGTLSSITINGIDIREIFEYCKNQTLENPENIDHCVRKYVAMKKPGRPRTLPEDSANLTLEQRRKREWNKNNKEHLRKYNKQHREKNKMLSNNKDDKNIPSGDRLTTTGN